MEYWYVCNSYLLDMKDTPGLDQGTGILSREEFILRLWGKVNKEGICRFKGRRTAKLRCRSLRKEHSGHKNILPRAAVTNWLSLLHGSKTCFRCCEGKTSRRVSVAELWEPRVSVSVNKGTSWVDFHTDLQSRLPLWWSCWDIKIRIHSKSQRKIEIFQKEKVCSSSPNLAVSF